MARIVESGRLPRCSRCRGDLIVSAVAPKTLEGIGRVVGVAVDVVRVLAPHRVEPRREEGLQGVEVGFGEGGGVRQLVGRGRGLGCGTHHPPRQVRRRRSVMSRSVASNEETLSDVIASAAPALSDAASGRHALLHSRSAGR